MPIPTIYTEPELIAKLQIMIRQVLDVVGWADTDPIYHEVVVDTLNEYGVTTIANATDVLKLLKLARFFMWKAVVDSLSVRYDFADGGASYNRSQMFKAVNERYLESFNAAIEYLSEYQIDTITTVNPDDVYRYIDTGDEFAG